VGADAGRRSDDRVAALSRQNEQLVRAIAVLKAALILLARDLDLDVQT
jgi:hypothetical protein